MTGETPRYEEMTQEHQGRLAAEQNSANLFFRQRRAPSGEPLRSPHYSITIVENKVPPVDGREEKYRYIRGYNNPEKLRQFIENEVEGTDTDISRVQFTIVEEQEDEDGDPIWEVIRADLTTDDDYLETFNEMVQAEFESR